MRKRALSIITILALVFSVIFIGIIQNASAITVFPIKLSSNGRYLTDQNNSPFFMVADTAWTLCEADANSDLVATYLDDRVSKGINTINITAVSWNPTRTNWRGDHPFINNDIATPNDNWFSNIDVLVQKCADRGLLVLLGSANWGSGSTAYQSYLTEDNAGPYGQYLGNRYSSYDNIIWFHGGDTMSSTVEASRIPTRNLANGIKVYDTGKLHTYHIGIIATSSYFMNEPWLSYNTYQSYYAASTFTYTQGIDDYVNHGTKPSINMEPCYEYYTPGGVTVTAYHVRQAAGWSVLSGNFGMSYGCSGIYDWSNVAARLNAPGVQDYVNIANMVKAREWYKLVPDNGHTMLTLGYGSGTSYASAARASDGSFGLAYLPDARSVTVNMSQFSGSVTAKWFDPTNGQYTTIGTYANSGSQNFGARPANSDGQYDWFLVLDTGGTPTPTPTPTPGADLKGYWMFDETSGTNASDSSGNGKDGTVFGATWTTGWKYNGALNFDGTNDYVSTPFILDPAATNFTATAWIKTDTISGNHTILQQVDGGGNGRAWLYLKGDKLASYIGNSETLCSNTLSTGTGYHVVLVKNGTNIKLYVDAVERASSTKTAEACTSGGMRVGTSKVSDMWFDGIIDDVRIYGRVLSNGEISDLYNGGAATPTPTPTPTPTATPTSTPGGNLRGYWMFDETSGIIASDSSGNGNDGTVFGATWTAGWKYNGALNFDGTNDYVSTPFILNPAATNFTAAAWIKTDTISGTHCILQQVDGGGNGRTWLYLNGDKLASYIGNSETLCSNTLSTGTGYHVVLVKNGTNIKLYVNAVERASSTKTVEACTSGGMRVGTSKVLTTWFDGIIDQVRIYNYAMSSSEITTLYNSGQ